MVNFQGVAVATVRQLHDTERSASSRIRETNTGFRYFRPGRSADPDQVGFFRGVADPRCQIYQQSNHDFRRWHGGEPATARSYV